MLSQPFQEVDPSMDWTDWPKNIGLNQLLN